ncbi:uncharacterized protein LOC127810528 isoform X2 [Diospyros lotus]|uniref:uncharacterized protein LOC127810528 isoform X2 n=1 Tax=Diospyros lotus TaxID=55363 RepID=UPI002257636D|nr:uncharacterized protein LOC127810528 isoform X2 [Diospyros lotus]
MSTLPTVFLFLSSSSKQRQLQGELRSPLMATPDHPRLVIHNFLSPDLCKELEFIHKSCGTVGYRPNVFSTTLSHLIATNCGHLIMPFVPIRERLREKAEEFFGCEFELFVEFTGLISWIRGASIGWHSDDNRPYLKQRDFAAVCYLNSYGGDFEGGLFHFQEWEPATIEPMAGDVVMYTADSRNIHSVDEITDGERLTLTLWFTRDGSHDEDSKLISFLSQSQLNSSVHESRIFLPLPASSKMYWFPPNQASTCEPGFDIRLARIHVLGYGLCPPQCKSCFTAVDSCDDFSETLMEQPLKLTRENELLDVEFGNILHVLQVVQFYHWKTSRLQTSEHEKKMKVVPVSGSQREEIDRLRQAFLTGERLAETFFGSLSYDASKQQQHPFNWTAGLWWYGVFSAAELPRFHHPSKAGGSLSFLVVGDWGRKGLYNQSRVAFQMGRIGEEQDIDFVISTGDNFYEDGLSGIDDPAFEQSFSDIYTAPSLQKKWFNVLGNHDYRGDVEAQLSPVLREKDKRWFCWRSFIVDAGMVEFFFVDTTPFVDGYFTDAGDHTYDWRGVLPRKHYLSNLLKNLDFELRNSPAKWKIVVGHHTIKSAGHHGVTQELVVHLLPILEANNVDMYMNGHDHCLQRITSSDGKIEFLTSGGGSKAWRGDVKWWNPEEMKFYYDGQGFMSVQLYEDEANFVYYDVFGSVKHEFKVLKQLHSPM